MKKRYITIVALMAIGLIFSSCNKDREVYQEPQGNESFKDLKVPDNFTWSAIADKNLSVTIQLDGQETSAFDATPLDLMDENRNLIDRSTIYNGQVEFFFRVPTKTKTIRLYSPLVNESKDISVDENVVTLNFDIKPQKAALVDTDGDGVADRFDDFPQDDQRAYSISFPASANKQYLKNALKSSSNFNSVDVDFEAGNTNYYKGLCWQFYGAAVENNCIAGHAAGVKTDRLTTAHGNHIKYKVLSPWYSFDGSNTLSFIHQLSGSQGSIKHLDVYLVNTDGNSVTTLLDYEYNNTVVQSESISINESGIFRIEWHFYGAGGHCYGNLDDIELDATDATDYGSNNGSGICQPITAGPAPGEPEYTTPEAGEGYYYQIFEDLWPSTGDYDLNDMVLKTKFGWDKHADNSLKHVYFQTIVQAVGAGIRSGLGWELLKHNGDEREYLNNVVTWYGASADPNVNCGVIGFNDVRDWQTTPYHNTSASGIDAKPDTIEFQVYIPQGVLCGFELIPYLFRSNNQAHQLRPFGAPPTASADMDLFGTYDDASPSNWNSSPGTTFPFPLTGANAFYRTAENLPWSVEFIATDFEVAEEKTDFLQAYPLFQNWAESGGTENQDWYLYPDHTHTYVPSW